MQSHAESLSHAALIPFGCVFHRGLLGHVVILVLTFGGTSIPLCIKNVMSLHLHSPCTGLLTFHLLMLFKRNMYMSGKVCIQVCAGVYRDQRGHWIPWTRRRQSLGALSLPVPCYYSSCLQNLRDNFLFSLATQCKAFCYSIKVGRRSQPLLALSSSSTKQALVPGPRIQAVLAELRLSYITIQPWSQKNLYHLFPQEDSSHLTNSQIHVWKAVRF